MARSQTEELLRKFQLLSHMNIALYDEQFRCIHSMIDRIPYCSAVHKSPLCFKRCVQSDREAFDFVKQNRRACTYTCPFGLWEAIYPILTDEHRILGYLFAGPARIREHALSNEELCRLAQSFSDELNREALADGADALPLLSEEEISAIEELFRLLAEHIANNRLMAENTQSLGQLMQRYIRKHLTEKITLSELGRNLHCSTVTLTETFRKEFGMTIMTYVTKERLKLACQLLENPSLSISDVAERCGFQDVEYFSRCFKKNEQLSPSAWRKKRQAESS